MEPRDDRILAAVGGNLRAERARRGMTQEAVARLAGMHTTQVARMERGEVEAGIAKFVRVAWAIGVSPADLFHGLDSP